MTIRILITSMVIILSFIFSGCSSQLNTQKSKEQKEELDSYKILHASPTLQYVVRKVGNGDKIMFSMKNGTRNLPQLEFHPSSGAPYKSVRKRGFTNVNFPFTCTISCSGNFMVNRFNDKPSLINDFKIEIREPGNWEISFR